MSATGASGQGGALAVLDTGVTFDDDGTAYPTAVIDVTDRPDVADLPRVHAVEGIGDLTTTLQVTDVGVTLTVRLTSPVRAAFALSFELPAHRGVLVAAARSNQLLLATTTPEPAGDHPAWLAIDLDGPRLGRLLDGLAGSGRQ